MDIRTDKTFNLTEYYGLKSIKLSDTYTVMFVETIKTEVDGVIKEEKIYYDMFFCENVKLPSLKNEVNKLENGAVGNKYTVFSHKPFDDITFRLIESESASVYKFLISKLNGKFDTLRHVYKNEMDEKLDVVISVFDNALEKEKLAIELSECRIVSYSPSVYNSSDLSTPYMYDVTINFNGLTYRFI